LGYFRALLVFVLSFFTAFWLGQNLISIDFPIHRRTDMLTTKRVHINELIIRADLIEPKELRLALIGTAVLLDKPADNTALAFT